MTSYTTPQKNALKERAVYCLAVCSELLAKGGRTKLDFLGDMCSEREGGGAARKIWDDSHNHFFFIKISISGHSGSNNFSRKKSIFFYYLPPKREEGGIRTLKSLALFDALPKAVLELPVGNHVVQIHLGLLPPLLMSHYKDKIKYIYFIQLFYGEQKKKSGFISLIFTFLYKSGPWIVQKSAWFNYKLSLQV